ncbi:MAG TPA: hypothetical protein PLY87_14410 [Planctomycetaceae bacterium]|nr:hypothetical protein [Planctomycetaceae bacterium]
MMLISFRRTLCLTMLLSVMGCGEEVNERLPPVLPVTGIVLLGDKAVEGATVTFFGSGADARTAFAKTDATGKFALTTFKNGDGAPVGQYAITVTKVESSEPDENGVVPPDKQLLPERYGDLGTSPLTAQVTEPGPNDVKLILE